MSQTMSPHWHDYAWFGWLDQPPYNSGEKQRKFDKQKMDGVFHRASTGGRSLKRETQRREREMLKKARQIREEREWREKDVERARREAQGGGEEE